MTNRPKAGTEDCSTCGIGAALALSVTLHLALLALPAGGGTAGPEGIATRTGRLDVVLAPAATRQPRAVRRQDSTPASANRSRNIPDRPPDGNPQPIEGMAAPPPPPDIAPWLDAAELDALPRPLSRPVPEYPPEAARDGVEGFVTLQLHVDERGIVRQSWVTASSPHGVFERSALRAVEAMRFAPGEKEFRFVRSSIPFTLEYRRNR